MVCFGGQPSLLEEGKRMQEPETLDLDVGWIENTSHLVE